MRVGDHIKKPEMSPVSVCFANIRNPLAIVLLSRSLPFSLSSIRFSPGTITHLWTKTDTYRKEIILGILLKTRFVG